jgi:hypothetical protein
MSIKPGIDPFIRIINNKKLDPLDTVLAVLVLKKTYKGHSPEPPTLVVKWMEEHYQ